jgi:hypothetical protein
VQPGHDGPDRDIEDLRRIGIAEIADIDEDEHVAEIVRHLRERGHRIILGEPPVDPLLICFARLLELVVEEVSPSSGCWSGERWMRRPRSMFRFGGCEATTRRFVPGWYDCQERCFA